MNLETSLYYVTHHSETIIQWLFLAILLTSAFVIGRAIFGKKQAEADGSDIQKFLQRILDQTTKLEGVSLDTISPKGMLEVEAQVQALKKDLQAREEELSKVRASGNTKVGGDADKLSTRIKELESKLAEYEILEDDIADLSLYKEENLRLRSELDKAKSGGDAAADKLSASMSPGEDIVAEFAQAVSQEVSPSAENKVEINPSGNPMEDFASAMQLEKKIHGEVTEALGAAPSAQPPPPAAPEAPTEGDDLFAEFANPPVDAEVEPVGLDTDKMMAEMAALVSMEPTKGSALHEEIDTEKMAAEATGFTKS